jgi:hypothetical protein
MTSLMSSSTSTSVSAMPMQIDHWAKDSSVVWKIRWSSPRVVTRMMAARAIP